MFLSPQSARRDPEDVNYPGKPLAQGCIRLIRLLPGTWKEPIRCELFEDFHGMTRYQALSYVWGSKNVTRPILLDGRSFPVTVDLESALRHLRERQQTSGAGLVLWIDALCINQQDLEERTHQVKFMATIYRRCEQVIVYLGDRLDGTARLELPPAVVDFEREDLQLDKIPSEGMDMDIIDVFSMFRFLAKDKHLGEVTALNSSSSLGVSDGRTTPGQGVRRLDIFEALRRMMNPPFTPWWSRIWVIQEDQVAPEVLVVYGTISAPWRIFPVASAKFLEHISTCCALFANFVAPRERKVLNHCFQQILKVDDLRKGRRQPDIKNIPLDSEQGTTTEKKWPLLDLLQMFRDRKASDARDKVYALLGLTSTSPWMVPLSPDYSLSEVEVFCQATLQCIYQCQNLSVFSTDLGRKFRNDLPSWVPDWSAPGGPIYEAREAAVKLYSSGLGANTHSVRLGEGHSLRVVGSKFGTITRMDKVMWGGDEPNIWRNTLTSWLRAWNQNNSGACSNLAFLKAICGDTLRTSDGTRALRRTMREDDHSFVLWALRSPRSPIAATHQEMDKALRHARWLNPTAVRPCDLADELRAWLRFPEQFISDYKAAVRLLIESKKSSTVAICVDVICGLMLHNNIGFRDNTTENASWKQIFNRVREHVIHRESLEVSVDLGMLETQLPLIEKSVIAATLSRRLIESGKVTGLGPADARLGDELYFLKGGSTPFVLRRKPTRLPMTASTGRYEIVGDCYLHGLMDGYASSGEASGNWENLTLL